MSELKGFLILTGVIVLCVSSVMAAILVSHNIGVRRGEASCAFNLYREELIRVHEFCRLSVQAGLLKNCTVTTDQPRKQEKTNGRFASNENGSNR